MPTFTWRCVLPGSYRILRSSKRRRPSSKTPFRARFLTPQKLYELTSICFLRYNLLAIKFIYWKWVTVIFSKCISRATITIENFRTCCHHRKLQNISFTLRSSLVPFTDSFLSHSQAWTTADLMPVSWICSYWICHVLRWAKSFVWVFP